MSTLAEVQAAAGIFRRQLKPEPELSGGDREPSKGRLSFIADTATISTWLPLVYPGKDETVVIQGTSRTRKVPLKHPTFPTMLAKSYRVRYRWGEYDTITQGSTVGEALCFLDVDFEEPPFGLSSDEPFQRISTGQTSRTIPVDTPAFSGGGAPLFDAPKPIFGTEYRVSIFDASGIDADVENVWSQNAGKVNSDYWRGYAPGYVLYKGPQLEYQYKFGGVKTCTYTLLFEYSPVPWNSFYKDGTLTTLQVGGGNYFTTVPFSSLWY